MTFFTFCPPISRPLESSFSNSSLLDAFDVICVIYSCIVFSSSFFPELARTGVYIISLPSNALPSAPAIEEESNVLYDLSLFNNTGLPLRSTLPCLDDPLDNLLAYCFLYVETISLKVSFLIRSVKPFWFLVISEEKLLFSFLIIFCTFCPSDVNMSLPDKLTPNAPDNSLLDIPVFCLRVLNCLFIEFCQSVAFLDVSLFKSVKFL